jgi:hypothetical protein
VAVVAEGPTDVIVIEAVLRALLPHPFVLTQLQPEVTRPKVGAGWPGVLRWCRDNADRGVKRLEDDPALPGFDLFVLHVDADVADASYDDLGAADAQEAVRRGWPTLPASQPCPPPSSSAEAMRARVLAWANLAAPGPRTVICVPSKATEAWLAAALLDNGHKLLVGLECNSRIGAQLTVLPKGLRIAKREREYRARQQAITAAWPTVRRRCTLAERFSIELLAAAGLG